MIEKLGHYQIISELGRGGMGVVYKGFEAELDRFVAIKVLGGNVAGDQTLIARFRREARSAASLSHPNIIQIYFIGEEQGQPFFVMEYVDGESLSGLIRRNRRIPPERAAGIILQTAAGLAEAHDRGIVHRDIKPGNIMITPAGLVKVADFGIAFVPDQQTRLTATGQFMGTPGYLPPEVCTGSPTDLRSDIFSLGMVYFEMLTGVLPFHDDSPLAMMHKVVTSDIPDIRQLNDKVDVATCDLLARMVAKSPDERFQDCHQLIAALESGPARGFKIASLVGLVHKADSAADKPTEAISHGGNSNESGVPRPPRLTTLEASAEAQVPTVKSDSNAMAPTLATEKLPPPESQAETVRTPVRPAAVPPPPLHPVPGVVVPPTPAEALASRPHEGGKKPFGKWVPLVGVLLIGAILIGGYWMVTRSDAGDSSADSGSDSATTKVDDPENTKAQARLTGETAGDNSQVGNPSDQQTSISAAPIPEGDHPISPVESSSREGTDAEPNNVIADGQHVRNPQGLAGPENALTMGTQTPGQSTVTDTDSPGDRSELTSSRPVNALRNKSGERVSQKTNTPRSYPKGDPKIAVIGLGDPLLASPLEHHLESYLAQDGTRLLDENELDVGSNLNREERLDTERVRAPLYNAGGDMLLVMRVEYLGERELDYMGRYSTAYQVRIHTSMIGLGDRKRHGSWQRTLEYTQLNAERKAEEAARLICHELQQKLEQD